ncbi:cylicin-1-like [Contarinia nasturtii]|uniref:cylicin-1-like n=1 Tax=Contarinia nasturtii TaxID=265458 RepID=UPI0012D41563|nr:cylicin-1-like [Contarinia nasturtii]
MLKLIFVTCLIAYVASIPVDEKKTPPKSEERVLIKREDHIAAGKAYADKVENQKKNDEAQSQNNSKTVQNPKHLKKRETESTPPKKSERQSRDVSKEKPQSDRKTRDTSNQKDASNQDQHRSYHETSNIEDKNKPKHDIPPFGENPAKPIQKRETDKDEPKKHIDNVADDEDDQSEKNKRPTRETSDEVKDKKPEQKTKRETNEPKPKSNDAKNQPKTGSFGSH